jgi:hypothetical protein
MFVPSWPASTGSGLTSRARVPPMRAAATASSPRRLTTPPSAFVDSGPLPCSMRMRSLAAPPHREADTTPQAWEPLAARLAQLSTFLFGEKSRVHGSARNVKDKNGRRRRVIELRARRS